MAKIRYKLYLPIEKIKCLVESCQKGIPITYACDKAMIPAFYISRWRKELDEYLARAETDEDIDLSFIEPPYDKNGNLVYEKLNTLSLSVVIKNARANYLENLTDLLKACAKDSDAWQKYAWLLERSFRDAYSKDYQEPTSKVVESIKIVYVDENTDKDRLEQLEKEVKENING